MLIEEIGVWVSGAEETGIGGGEVIEIEFWEAEEDLALLDGSGDGGGGTEVAPVLTVKIDWPLCIVTPSSTKRASITPLTGELIGTVV